MTGPEATRASGREDITVGGPPEATLAPAPSADEVRAASTGQTSDAGEYLTAAAIIVMGGLFWIGATDYGETARRWPVFLCYIVVGLGVVNLVALVFRRVVAGRPATVGDGTDVPASTTAEDLAEEDTADRPVHADYRRQVTTGLFALAYAGIGYGAGFLVATALLVPLYILLSFRRRRPLLAVLVTLALLVFMRLIFTGALNAPLERGVWMGVDLSWLPF